MPTYKTLVRCAALSVPAIVALSSLGCARAVVTTTVKPDGAFTRKIVFHGPKADDKAGGLPIPGVELKDSFELPSGGPWKTKHEKLEKEEVYTAERDLTPGSVQKQDIAVKGGDPTKPGVFVVNEASVRSAGPGKWEYHETLHWNGKLPDITTMVTPDGLQTVKAALPPALATDANVRPIAAALTRAIGHAMFGPGDPLISSWSQFMMQPEIVARKMQAMASPALDKAVAAQLGDKLSAQARHACVRKIIESIANGITSKTAASADPTKAGAKPDLGEATLAALTFSVKLPGKIVSTNGERDDFNHEVYWSVYPEAAALGDVEMTAVCDTKAP